VIGERQFKKGEQATEHSDDYIFATVLFFAGISMRFAWWPMRLAVLAFGAMSFLYGLVQLLTLPAH
jgi:hypothetical protein